MRSFFKFSRWVKKSEFLSPSSRLRKTGTSNGGEVALIPYFRYTLLLPLVMFLFSLPLPKRRYFNRSASSR